MMKRLTIPVREVQTGYFRDQNGEWEIIRIDVVRNGLRRLVVKKRGQRVRWPLGTMDPDAMVTVYKKPCE